MDNTSIEIRLTSSRRLGWPKRESKWRGKWEFMLLIALNMTHIQRLLIQGANTIIHISEIKAAINISSISNKSFSTDRKEGSAIEDPRYSEWRDFLAGFVYLKFPDVDAPLIRPIVWAITVMQLVATQSSILLALLGSWSCLTISRSLRSCRW